MQTQQSEMCANHAGCEVSEVKRHHDWRFDEFKRFRSRLDVAWGVTRRIELHKIDCQKNLLN